MNRDLYFNPAAWKDYQSLGPELMRAFGFGLRQVQRGVDPNHVEGAPQAKSLNKIAPGVSELLSDDRAGTYRVVYTVKLAETVYVLHCFQKKSTIGIKTGKTDIALIKERLAWAEAHHKASMAAKAKAAEQGKGQGDLPRKS